MAEELKQVADLVTANILFCTKEVLTSDEAAEYMGISKSYLYKLTMRKQIPHYKPMGKMCYFNFLLRLYNLFLVYSFGWVTFQNGNSQ